ncbi:MAG: C69 family dipeptidase [Bacteroidaceae bacterium]|nr:C69 family dipeptidase [Bacteroidaceae bacterium]
MKRISILLGALLLNVQISIFNVANACTNLIVGKKASKDGSVIISYSQDDYGAFEPLRVIPAADHPAGTMHLLYHYESGNYLGEIPEVAHTYGIVGLMNEFQLSIHETTYGGREELTDTVSGLIDYGSLMVLALQRAKTAREAIQVMTELTEKYGYESEGESFTIADPNEAWIMDMIGKGPGRKGTVWVAVRIPDDCISGHANQSRIHQFPLKDKKNCLYAKDVISFAKEKGYFNGKDTDFSFADAYAPLDFGGLRYCEARIWSFFNKWASEDMSPYLPFAMGDTKAEVLPLYVKPKAPLSVQDVKDMMRDHYEGTPMDMTQDIGMGAWEMPYRPTPLSFEVDGKKYFNERPISTQQSACVYVSQMRSWLPNHIGGVTWFANDDANMVAFTPIYCNTTQAPECYDKNTADAFHFSTRSAYWVENWVSNMVYLRYNLLFPELKKVRDKLEKDFNSLQDEVESKAASISKEEAVKYLSAYSHRVAGAMMDEWNQLAQLIIVKYNDMAVKRMDENGQYEKTPGGNPRPVLRPGYPEAFKRELIKQTGSRYKLPQ